MSKGNTFENELLAHIFQNADIPLIGDAAGLQNSAAAGNLYIALHTADPGEGGSQNTTEAAYTGYARKAVARQSGAGGFTVTGNSVSPTDNQDFGECTASPGSDLTYFSVGTDSSGAGKILYKGALSPVVAMAVGVIPRVKNTSAITED